MQTNHTNLSVDQDNPVPAAPYVQGYQLHSSPFTASIPKQKYYIDEPLQQCLDQLNHLTQSSDLTLVVSAEDGAGKSTLMHMFTMQASSPRLFCQVAAHADLSSHELLVQIQQSLNLPGGNIEQMDVMQLKQEARKLAHNDILPIIIIDDADLLSHDTLTTLLELQSITDYEGNDAIWHIIMFARPSLTAELMSTQSRFHFIKLAPLSRVQTRNYLQHRLNIAGLTGELPFTLMDLEHIHKNSKGNIASIHYYAHQILLNNSKTGKNTMKKKSSKIVYFSTLIVGLLVAVLIFQDDINKSINATSTSTATVAPSQPDIDKPQQQGYLLSSIANDKPVDWSNIPALSMTPAAVTQKAAPAVAQQVAVVTPVKESTVVSTTKATIDVTDDLKPAAITPKPTPTIIAKKSPAITTTQPLQGTLKKHSINGKNWIMTQLGDRVTAQLMASSKPEALIKLAKNPAFKGNTAIYQIKRNNNDWYVLIYGSFRDKLSSSESIKTLPANLRKNKPWLRAFSAVQTEIKAGKK